MAKKKRRKRCEYTGPRDFQERVAKDLGLSPDDPKVLRMLIIMQEILDR